jgi:hypothetical protein
MFLVGALGQEISPMASARLQLRAEFTRLDRNRDRQLTKDEFVGQSYDAKTRARDFILMDQDENAVLRESEFAVFVGMVDPQFRGHVPDPFERLLSDAVAALDESYQHWNQRPSEKVSAHTFVANFIGSISHGRKRYVTGRIMRQADQDADGLMSRKEAKVFLEQQLGMRWGNVWLRESTGRLLRFDQFIQADDDQDGVLSELEFQIADFTRMEAEPPQFSKLDRDGNGSVTHSEYAHYESENFLDLIDWFRRADSNLVTRLS